MAAGTRQASRFEMLINVAVHGNKEMSKLAGTAKAVAIKSEKLGDALKILDTTTGELSTKVKKLKDALEDYLEQQKIYNVHLRSRRKLETGLSENLRMIEQLEKKGTKTAIKKIEVLTAANTILRKSIALETKSGLVAQKSMTQHKKAINKVLPGTIKWVGGQKKLAAETKKLKLVIADLGEGVKESRRRTKASTQATQKDTRETKKGSKAKRILQKDLTGTAHAFNKLTQRVTNATEGFGKYRRILGALRNQILVVLFATRALRGAFNAAHKATVEMESALRGLGSVALNTGTNVGIAKNAAIELARSGLMTVNEAAAGLKNLLSAGFGLPEATAMMNTLTDAAAFNRQGTLKLGEAIVGATQGIKNQNSIMVDNAGITKNLSVMYKEYANTIGTTGGKLTELQKRTAIYNGILKEGSIFAGDAAKVIDTLQGTMARLATESFKASAALGDALRPAMESIYKALTDATIAIREFFEDEDVKIAFMDAFKVAADGMVTSLKFMAGAVIWIAGLFKDADGKQIQWMVTLLKWTAMWKIGMVILGRHNKLLVRAVKTNVAYAIGVRTATRADVTRYTVIEKGTGREILGRRKLIILYKHYYGALVRVNRQYAYQIKSMGLLHKVGAKLNLIWRRGTQGITAMTRAMKGMKVAGKLLTATIATLAWELAAIMIIFYALERLWSGIKWLWEMGKRAAETAAAIQKLGLEMKKLAVTYKMMDQKSLNVAARMTGVGISIQDLKAERINMQNHYNLLLQHQKDFNVAADKEARNAIQEKIDAENEAMTETMENLVEQMHKVEAKYSDFYSRINKISQDYLDLKKAAEKKYGLGDVLDAAIVYTKILSDKTRVLDDLKKLENVNKIASAIQRSRRDESELMAQKLFLTEMTDFRKKYNQGMVQLDRQLSALMVAGAEDTSKSIASKVKKAFDDLTLTLSSVTGDVRIMLDQLNQAINESVFIAETDLRKLASAGAPRGMEAARGDTVIPEHVSGMGQKIGSDVEKMNVELIKWSEELDNIAKAYAAGGKTTKALKGELTALIDQYDKGITTLGKKATSNVKGNAIMKAEIGLINILKGEAKDLLGLADVKIAKDEVAKEVNKQVTSGLKDLIDAETEYGEKIKTATDLLQDKLTREKDYKDYLVSSATARAIAAVERETTEMIRANIAKRETIGLEMELREARTGWPAHVDATAMLVKVLEGGNLTLAEFKEKMEALHSKQAEVWPALGGGIASVAVNMTGLGIAFAGVNAGMKQHADGYKLAGGAIAGASIAVISYMGAIGDLKIKQLEMQLAEDSLIKSGETKRQGFIEEGLQIQENIKHYSDIIDAKSGTYPPDEVAKARIMITTHQTERDALVKLREEFEKTQTMKEVALNGDLETQYAQQIVSAMSTAANAVVDYFDSYYKQQNKYRKEQRKYNAEFAKMRKEGRIDESQEQELRLASNEYMAAKEKFDNEKSKADLLRNIASQIMAWAALKAAQSGNIVAAGVILLAAAIGTSVINKYASDIENAASRQFEKAEAKFEQDKADIIGEDEEAEITDEAKKFGGTIKAESLQVSISPTIVIQGEQIFIGQGSVTEFSSEMQALLLTMTNEAIENREIDISSLQGVGG
jgi:hypothetical protein